MSRMKMSDYIDVKLNPADVLTEREFEALAEAICEHLSDKTGFCAEGLSIGFDVAYTLDTSDEEERVMNEEKLALVVANCAEEMVCAADVERRDEDEVSIAVPCEEWDALISALKHLQESDNE